MAIRLPTASDPVAGLAVDGAPMALMTIPGTPNDPTGPLCIGADLLNGVPQSAAGSFGITAIYVAKGRDDATLAALRQLARDHLAPIVAPISAVAAAGAPRTLDLAPYVTDPAGAGFSVTVGALPPGLSASVAGSVLTYSSAAEASYSLPLIFTGLNSLQPARHVTAHLTLASESARWSNGYRWRGRINLLPWNASGTIPNFLLPFAEVDPAFRSIANGGYVESSDARDFRLETAAGVKIPHVLLAYDPVIGLIAGFGNIAARNIGVAEAGYTFVGKPGLSASEEDPVGCRAGGWLFFGSGHSAVDFSGQGRDWTTNVDVGQGRIGPWPAGVFNGLTSYRARASSEMNGLAGVTVVALAQSGESAGRTQEFLNVAPADVADLALRLGSSGNWVLVIDAGGQLQAVQSDTGLYYPGRPHAVAGVWSSGGRPSMYVDGALVDPATPPAVATGTTAINEALELGRGNRPAGAATWWNGLIGPVLGCNRGLARAEIECLAAALAEPRLVYGRGAFKTVDTAAVPPIAQPVEVTVPAGATSAPVDVQAAAYNPDGLPLTTTVGAPTSGNALVAADGKVLLSLPPAAANQRHYFPFSLASGLMSSSSIISVRVGPAVVTTPAGLPIGYPTPPDMSGWAVVTVSTNQQLKDAIAAATSAGRIIRLAAGTNDFGSVTISNAGARIAIIAQAPRFSGLITDRATLDGVDLTLQSKDDPAFEDRCVVGGRAAFKAHTATNRLSLNVVDANTVWVEGVDFYDSGFDYKFEVTRPSGSSRNGYRVDQVWLRKCSFADTFSYLCGPTGGAGGAGNSYSFDMAARIFVVWECYYYGDGSKKGTSVKQGDISFYTDYLLRLYNTKDVYVYRSAFKGGANHMISLKTLIGSCRIDDCVFAPWDSIGSKGFNCIEPGQEGTAGSNDQTCGLVTIRGCTFARSLNASVFKVMWFKEAAGLLFDGNMVYNGIPQFLIAGRDGDNAGTKAGNSDIGQILAGSEDVTVTNNTFRGNSPGTLGTPGTVNLYRLFLSSGGTYQFIASNNRVQSARAISIKTNGVTKSIGANAGFS